MQKLNLDSATKSTAKKNTTLTVNKIRRYKGLENLTEIQARDAISAIEKLSNLLFFVVKNDEIIDHENKSTT